MRIRGRSLRPSTLAERRLMLGHFGTDCIRVPRTLNPFAVARRIRRLACNEELSFMHSLACRMKKFNAPPVSPDVDVTEPAPEAEDAAAAAE